MRPSFVRACLLELSLVLTAVFLFQPDYCRAQSGEIKQWYTENGMQVIFKPEQTLPMIDFRLIFDAGSARDSSHLNALSGLANLTNQLIFTGSDRLNEDQIANALADAGVDYGNGIERDMAKIYFRSLSDRTFLEPAIATLGSILSHANFPPQAVERARNQIQVELDYALQAPAIISSRILYQTLYGSHPYATPLNGTRESINKITRNDILAFYRQYYTAQNALLVMVGDINEHQARNISQQLSLALPKGQKAPELPPVYKTNISKLTSKDFNSSQTTVFMGQIAVKRNDPDYIPLYVGNYILGSFGARLTKEIRYNRGLTYSIESLLVVMKEPGLFLIKFSSQQAYVKEIIQLINLMLEDFITYGPTPAELKQAKMFINSNYPFRLDSNQDMVENLSVIGFYDLPLTYLDDYMAKIQAVSVEQIREAFSKHVDVKKMLTVIVGPVTEQLE